MPIHTDSTHHVDFQLVTTVPDYWERANREEFLHFALIWATDELAARRLAIPEPAALTRIVLLAYQSAMLLTHATQTCSGNDFTVHVRRFIIAAVRSLNRRKRYSTGSQNMDCVAHWRVLTLDPEL